MVASLERNTRVKSGLPTGQVILKVGAVAIIRSIITETDMKKYSPRDREPISKIFKNNVTLYSASLPGSGALLAFILGVLDGYEDFNAEVWRKRGDTVKTLHRIIEIFKFAYGSRMVLEDSDSDDMKQFLEILTSDEYANRIRKLIDDERTYDDLIHYGVNVTVLEDHGTAHVSIIAPNGDAVSVTSTIAA
ncbi:glutathione hydrolase 5 proenzyme [Trichonephila clavipes]|uniref:Glutathione hydrolase 5 proenzyme n=1 Tax=Trichonephila clavipes TaxID=2585209 RepID=A0A8X6RIJ7_TRICX|nr:glutathione hydrolase 5 proenzyme [Trichonephila clavipes]